LGNMRCFGRPPNSARSPNSGFSLLASHSLFIFCSPGLHSAV
jgi:hypothetical protein